MKKEIIALILVFSFISSLELYAQSLDRVAFASAGSSDVQISYVIGETFNETFIYGNAVFELGSQSSTYNTGGIFVPEITKEEYSISCYPNPVSNNLFYTIEGLNKKKLTVIILDIKGVIIESTEVSYMKIMKCNVSDLQAGSYFIGVQSENGKMFAVKKFVKK